MPDNRPVWPGRARCAVTLLVGLPYIIWLGLAGPARGSERIGVPTRPTDARLEVRKNRERYLGGGEQ